MKRIRIAQIFAFLLLPFIPAFAGGKKEQALEPASGSGNWEKTFDISGKKPGVYNIVVEGTDQAGNATTAGPINIYVDPKTDLPIAVIANPVPSMRVAGDLNVVGTCVDDDGVAKVELRLDDGEWIEARGTSFWSYSFKGADIPDGRRSISVRGTDVNGLVGPARTVSFDMDKRRPLASVDSPSAGTLAAGRVALRGSVFDANGVASVEYSLDGGQTYVKTKGPYDKKAGIRSFVVQIDTRKMADGPSVVLLKSVDGVGSVALAPVLLVVDNTKPVVELASPASGEKLDGDFVLYGYAKDEVGIKSLSWKIGDQGGEIPANPGDPFWTVPVSLSRRGGKEATLVLSAVDLIGNRTEARYRIALDAEADKPRVALLEPAPGAKTEGGVFFAGYARDDDGVAAVEYWVDKGAPVRVETSGAFGVRLQLAPGKRTLYARAVDVKGLAGPAVSVEIEDIGAAPELAIAEVVYGASSKDSRSEPFASGVEIAPDAKASFRLIAKGSRLGQIEWKLSGPDGAGGIGGSLSAKGAEGAALLPLPADGPYGALELSVRVSDAHGRSAAAKGLVRVVDYSAVRGDPSFVFVDERLDADLTMRFGQGSARRPLVGRFVGATLSSVRLEPESPGWEMALDGPFVSIAPKADGSDGIFVVVGKTDRGHEFRSERLSLRSDVVGPTLRLDAAPAAFVGSAAILAGQAEDASGLAALWYSLNGGARVPIELPRGGGRFELRLDLADIPDGQVSVSAAAEDAVGNGSGTTLFLTKDTEGPTIEFVSAGADGASTGLPAGLAAGTVADSGGVASLQFAVDGIDYRPLDGREAFAFKYDPAAAGTASLKAVDRAGNERIVLIPAAAPPEPSAAASPEAAPDDPKAVPSLTLLWPPADSRLTGAAPVLFKLASPRPVASLSWTFGAASGSVDPSLLLPLDGASSADRGGAFLCAFAASGIADKAGSAQLRIVVSDAAGKSAAASLRVSAAPEERRPTVSIAFPAEGAAVGSDFALLLAAAAPSGIASYRVSVDGGEARVFDSVGAASIPIAGLAAGSHAVAVAAVDPFGAASAPVKRGFLVVGAPPEPLALSLVRKEGAEPFRPGSAVAPESGLRLEGRFAAPNGAGAVELTVGGNALKPSVRKNEDGSFSWSAPLPPGLPYGRIDVSAKIGDKAGGMAPLETFFYRVAPLPAAGVFEEHGLRLADIRVSGDDSPVRLTDDAPLRFRFLGRPLSSARLDPPSEALALKTESGIVSIAAASDGTVPPTRLIAVDADGDEFSWGPRAFIVSRADPVLEVDSPAPDAWLRETASVSLRTSDSAGGRPELAYRLDGGDWLPLAADESALPLDGADGARVLRLRARDAAGREAAVERVVNKDAAPPQGSIVVPRSADAVNGRTTLAAGFRDAGGALSKLEFSLDGEKWESADRADFASRQVDFSAKDGAAAPRFRVSDAAGNVLELSPEFAPDSEADKPRVLVQLPEEGEVLRADFSVSGAAFDDDGPAAIHYRFDDGEWTRLPLSGNGFHLPVAFDAQTDNEHRVEIYAEDIYGVLGDPVARTYRVSREEPKAAIEAPSIDTTVSGLVVLRGSASDANGLESVDVSFDNAATFNRADLVRDSADPTVVGWSYPLNTRILADGLHSLYVRPVDSYGTEGFFASLVSVDNTPPAVSLDLPADGSTSPGILALSGRAEDSRRLRSLGAVVYPLDPRSGARERRFDLEPATVVLASLDLAGLPDGAYGLALSAVDEAGNEAVVSRDFRLVAGYRDEDLSIASPVAGERLSGKVRVQGRLRSPARVSSVSVFVDGADFVSVKPDPNGWFSADLVGAADLPPLAAGSRSIEVRFANDAGAVVSSGPVPVEFSPDGPWILADNFAPGSYIPYRPFLSGTAGWNDTAAPPSDPAEAKKAAALKRGREVASVEVSVDNGRTFAAADGKAKWKFRLETQNYGEGVLPVIVRAKYRNGQSSVSKLMLNLDKTPPAVAILEPAEGGRFNGSVAVSGVASDDVELVSVSLALRDGDKAGYELPSFIQGMYLDAHLLGEPVYEVGAGFTFFDDNVKLQFAYGYTPDSFMGQDRGRFHGNVFSAKLLANLLAFPFGFWLGPDWDFLSANFAIGANFSYFSETQSSTVSESSGTIIGAVVAQLEFPKLKFKKLPAFRSYSFYTEFQAWFVSAELDGGIKPALSVGLRMGLF